MYNGMGIMLYLIHGKEADREAVDFAPGASG